MIGLDTNVLVRYLTQDDPSQARLANRLFETELTADSPGFVNQVALCELTWVLEDCYNQGRAELTKELEQLLKVAEVRVEDSDTVRLAVADFRDGKADFSDPSIARRNLAHGDGFSYTFDKKATKEPGFSPLP